MKHLTKEEAEAVVLALGPQLEWRSHSIGVNPITSGWYKGECRYQVYLWAFSADSQVFLSDKSEDFDIQFKLSTGEWLKRQHNVITPGQYSYTEAWRQVAETKAACERHFATGKWE